MLPDFTGVPSIVDLAALRNAMQRMGGDPKKVNPLVPVDLVVDHSVQVNQFGSELALYFNAELEFERNRERYEFLKWGRARLITSALCRQPRALSTRSTSNILHLRCNCAR